MARKSKAEKEEKSAAEKDNFKYEVIKVDMAHGQFMIISFDREIPEDVIALICNDIKNRGK